MRVLLVEDSLRLRNSVATGLRKKLVDIQYGRTNDPHNWIRKVL